VDYSEDSLDGAQKGWERLMSAVRLTRDRLFTAPEGEAGERIRSVLEETRRSFDAAMDDDFNAPIAIAALQNLTREVNTLLLASDQPVGKSTLAAIDSLYSELGGKVLGLIPATEGTASANVQRETGMVKLLIELRQQAREQKQWATSDSIRNRLSELGVVLEDRADGTGWHFE